MNKTDRKNKTNLTVNWPAQGNYFTVKELWKQHNPDFIEITLRVRVDKAIKKDKTIAIIGYKNVGKGRPTMILAMNPISQELLNKAYADGIQPPEIKPLVTVMDVTTTPISTSEPATVLTADIPVSIATSNETTVSA
jgi:hypothetical protein